jgi:poly(A) polymerase
MTAEFKGGYDLTEQVMFQGKPWSTLTKPSRFFTTYRKYIQVLAWADTEDDYKKWIGAVESRVRSLTMDLGSVRFMNAVVPWPDHFDRPDDDCQEFAGSIFIGIDYVIPPEESINRRIDLSEKCQLFLDNMWADKKVRNEHMFFFMKLFSRSQVPDYVFPEGLPVRKTKQFELSRCHRKSS